MSSIRTFIRTYKPLLLLFAITFGCSALLVSIHLMILGVPGPHPFTFIAHLVPEALLLTLPVVMLWPRWKYLTPLLFLVASLFFFANILFFRNFSDILSIGNIRLAPTIDSLVLNSAIASIHWTDFTLFIPVFISFLSIKKLSKSTLYIKFPLKYRFIFLFVVFASFCAAQIKFYRNDNKQSFDSKASTEQIKSFFEPSLIYYDFYNHGLTFAIIYDIYREISISYMKQDLSTHKINEIKEWQDGDIAGTKSNKNIIYIIVESLNTIAVEWVHNNHSVMPNLRRIISDSSAVTFTAMCPQTGNGRSSDGQMMYNTGIYPSKHTAMPVISPEGPYPSIARMVYSQNNSMEIIPEAPYVWNHNLTSRAYGFDTLHHSIGINLSFPKRDSILFKEAQRIIQHTKEPFMAVITTVTMHDPYFLSKWEKTDTTWITQLTEIDERERAYFEACSAFDRALGQFFDWLQQSPLWKNTMIVIASDHEARKTCLPKHMSDDRLLFTVINSGHQGFKSDAVVGQIDVFPTVIDALGMWDTTPWHGFGTSLLRDIPGFALRHDGTVAGDTIGKSAAIERQRRAVELSQLWIPAKNKTAILDSLGIDSSTSPFYSKK